MKKRLLAAFFLLFSVCAIAQSRKEVQVGKAVEEMRQLMINPEKEGLDQMTDEQLSYGHSSGVIDNKSDFIEKLLSGRSDFVSIELKDQTIQVSGKVAIVRHALVAKTNDSGNPGEVQLKVLLVWKKKGKGWKLLARQAVK